jgi:class 3 adenylate cyclase/pimeloyl-ACP methyl ester carboxylesterase
MGEGPIDLVIALGATGHVDLKWDEPVFEDFHRRLASFTRLIMFDPRGCGASDPLPHDAGFAWESWVEDVGAVMDAAGSERAALLGAIDAGPAAILFAATRPERVSSLILMITTARFVEAPDYPEGLPLERARAMIELLKGAWGTPEFAATIYPQRASDNEFCNWYAKFTRAAASPRVMAEHLDRVLEIDVRKALPVIHAPTLVMHRTDYPFLPIAQGRHIAEHIPGARFLELPGSGGVMGEYVDETIVALSEFLTGAPQEPRIDRVLATVLFTDIVDSTGKASTLGDQRWRELLDRHDRAARGVVERFGGRVVKSTGDGVLATFDAPTRATRCAMALHETLSSVGLDIRAGLHTGEIELRGDDIGGIGVNIAARILDHAGAREVMVTRTVKELATGGDLVFTSRGSTTLRGVPDDWELYEATTR